MSSGATSFVVLGMCIGILIGLGQGYSKTWLTVLMAIALVAQFYSLDDNRVGSGRVRGVAIMGRGDVDVDMEHAQDYSPA